jgi:Cd(II)/Pb(II)-responsive transcriptional regulator
MKIGELANAAKCTTETIRFYEKTGLLPEAERTASNYRNYGLVHVERLRFIRNCRMLDMTHEEIRALLGLVAQPDEDCTAINELLDEHIEHVSVRINQLERLRQQLVALRVTCSQARLVGACGIVKGLAEMAIDPTPTAHTHLG